MSAQPPVDPAAKPELKPVGKNPTPANDAIKTAVEAIDDAIKDMNEIFLTDNDGKPSQEELELLTDGLVQKLNEHKYRAIDQHEEYLACKKFFNEEAIYWNTLDGEEKRKSLQIVGDKLPAAGKKILEDWHKQYDKHANHVLNLISQEKKIRQAISNYHYHIERIKSLKKLLPDGAKEVPSKAA